MNEEQRKNFWETLISLDGQDVEADRRRLYEKIIVPPYLYRYRPVNLRTLDALRTNKLCFSTANYYDDPFDTFINVDLLDLDRVYRHQMSDFDDKQIFELAKEFLNRIMPTHFDDDTIRNMVQMLKNALPNQEFYSTVLNYFRNIRNEIKKDIWSVCFSENGINEVLWLKYAQQHKGFVIQYDMERTDLLLCGKQEKCIQCGVNKWGTSLYPVYYSDKQYDGTRFAQIITYYKALSTIQGFGTDQMGERLISTFGNINWERERISLIKKECHKYDKEWRIILNCQMSGKVMREWIPSAVILGLNMGDADKNMTISAAKEAGIQNIYQSFVDNKGELNAELLQKD